MLNLLLAGIPRSGTTLACSLFNRLPEVAALPEPMEVGRFITLPSPDGWIDLLDDYISATRASILANGWAEAKLGNVGSEENYFPPSSKSDMRSDVGKKRLLTFANISSPDFTLVIKHPNAFSAMLEGLCEHYPVSAMIRNPLAVLASWNSIDAPFRFGRAPIAEAICPHLKERLARIPDRRARQLDLLSWYFEQYRQFLPDDRIIRYEALICSGGAALAPLIPSAVSLEVPLLNRNQSPAYAVVDLHALAKMLLASDGAFWSFYSRDAVRELLEASLT